MMSKLKIHRPLTTNRELSIKEAISFGRSGEIKLRSEQSITRWTDKGNLVAVTREGKSIKVYLNGVLELDLLI